MNLKQLYSKLTASIRTKMLLVYLLIVLPISLFPLLYYPAIQKEQTYHELEKYVELCADIRAKAYQDAANENWNIDFLEKNSQYLKSDRNFTFYILLDQDGVIQYKSIYNPNNYQIDTTSFFKHDKHWYSEKDNTLFARGIIHLTDSPSAMVILGYSLEETNTAIERFRNNSLAVTALLFIVGIVLIILLSSLLNKPIVILKNAAQRAGAGDFTAKAEIISHDEIGKFAAVFNQMIDKISDLLRESRASATKAEKAAYEAQLEKNKALYSQETIANKNKELEYALARVRELNARLLETNEELQRQKSLVEQERLHLSLTLDELRSTQTQLIHAEKMAAFGRIAAGIAHEINTPLGAIRACANNIQASINETLTGLPFVYTTIDSMQQALLSSLVGRSSENRSPLTVREARAIKEHLTNVLEKYSINDAETVADTLTDMGITGEIEDFLPLFRHEIAEDILQTAYNMSGLHRNAITIETAVSRASKIIFALKSYAREGQNSDKKQEVSIIDNIETVLTLYQNQLKLGVEVIREYGGNIPLISGYPDELYQVWTNIIHNSLQAMANKGTLKIEVRAPQADPTQTLPRREGFSETPSPHEEGRDGVLVRISDSGGGIPSEVLPRIFEPFFTTKSTGEGTGLGLDICRKIIDKHGGTIDVENDFGKGVAFIIRLPHILIGPAVSSLQLSVKL